MKYINNNELYKIYNNHPVITTDSRVCPQGSIFFALKGDNFNGNLFASKAVENGCAYAVIDEEQYATSPNILLVYDVLASLQELAAHHRKHLTIPVIGITGTNGKTTTKELTKAVLSQKYNVAAIEGNLNNHIGVPLTILKIRPEHEIAIIEMGANHPREIAFLCNISCPDFGLVTNVGKAHLEGFESFEGVVKTKSELYDSLRINNGGVFIYSGNHILLTKTAGLKKIVYGYGSGCFLTGELINADPFVRFSFECNGITTKVQTRLVGTYNLPNLLAAATIGRYFNVMDAQVAKALEEYTPSNKRSQLTVTDKNQLILDAYNANPTSMMAALKNFRDMNVNGKTLILGDMRELGEDSQAEHIGIVNFIKTVGFDNVYLIGKEFNSIPNPFVSFDDIEEFRKYLMENPLSDRFILVKGSRGIALEKIIDLL